MYDDIVYVVEMATKDKQYVSVLVGETYHRAVEASDEFMKEQSNNDAWDFSLPCKIELMPFYRLPGMDFWTTIAYILIVLSPWKLPRKLGCWIMIKHTRNLIKKARKGG